MRPDGLERFGSERVVRVGQSRSPLEQRQTIVIFFYCVQIATVFQRSSLLPSNELRTVRVDSGTIVGDASPCNGHNGTTYATIKRQRTADTIGTQVRISGRKQLPAYAAIEQKPKV